MSRLLKGQCGEGEDMTVTLAERVIKALAKGPTTRAKLAENLGVSRTSLHAALAPLIGAGYVSHVEDDNRSRLTPARPGRPVQALEFQPKRPYLAGFDVSRTSANAVLVNRNWESLATATIRTSDTGKWNELLDRAALELEKQASGKSIDLTGVAAVGVGVPLPGARLTSADKVAEGGEVNAEKLSIISQLRGRWSADVMVDNTVRMAAVGEMKWGAARPSEDIIYVSLNAGIGACAIIGGQVVRGVAHLAGEIGHLPIPGENTPCYCGGRGCLETIAAEPRVADEDGAVTRAALAIAQALTGAVFMLNPDRIVLGGTLTRRSPNLVEVVAGELDRLMPPSLNWKIRVVAAECDLERRAWGAIAATHEWLQIGTTDTTH